MRKVEFGIKKVSVSSIGFGGAQAGMPNYQHAADTTAEEHDRKAFEALQTAFRQGINYFDTAPAYGRSRSEKLFGEALSVFPRDEYFLATKVLVSDYDATMRSVEASLSNLRTTRLDLIQFHGNSFSKEQTAAILDKNGPMKALLHLKDQGVIDNIGFTSEDNNDSVYTLMNSGFFSAVQLQFNLIFQHSYNAEKAFGSLVEAKQLGISTTTMCPTTAGVFQRFMKQIRPDDHYDYNVDLLRFAMSNPYTDVVLIGMSSPARVLQNIEVSGMAAFDLQNIHKKFF